MIISDAILVIDGLEQRIRSLRKGFFLAMKCKRQLKNQVKRLKKKVSKLERRILELDFITFWCKCIEYVFFFFFDMYQKCVWLFLYGFWICFWELIQNLFTVKFTVKKNIITRMSKYTTRLGFVVLYWNLTRDFSRGSWVRFGPRDWINLFMFVLILYEKDKTAAHWFFSLCFRLFFRSLLLNIVLRNFLCQNNTSKLW